MKHFAAHDVIYIDFSKLPFEGCSYKDYMQAIKSWIKKDIQSHYPNLQLNNNKLDILGALNEAYNAEGARFCFIMDERDSMFYNKKLSKDDQKYFLMFLKQLLKDKPYVELNCTPKVGQNLIVLTCSSLLSKLYRSKPV